MKDKLPCGCVHDGTPWLQLCVACRAEYDERHERAQADYKANDRTRARPKDDDWLALPAS